MKIDMEKNGDQLCMQLDGRLDTTTSPDLDQAIRENLSGVSLLILDFENLRYVSSSGLRVLLATHKSLHKSGGKMVIRHANELVMEIFEDIGFAQIFNIENE